VDPATIKKSFVVRRRKKGLPGDGDREMFFGRGILSSAGGNSISQTLLARKDLEKFNRSKVRRRTS